MVMKKAFLVVVLFLFSASVAAAAGETPSAAGAEKKSDADKEYITLRVPFFSDRFSAFPVALVNGDPIMLEDLKKVVGARHEGLKEEEKSAVIDFSHMLGQLINAKLIVQEGRNIGLDELPEVKAAIDDFSKSTMREMLQKRQIADIKADEAEAERIYKESVKEYKIKLVVFDKEDAAKKTRDGIKAGKSFEELVDKAVAGNEAKKKEEEHMKAKDLSPQIAQVIAGMKAGDVSGIVKIADGKNGARFALVKLDEIRFPDDPKAKEEAQKTALSEKQWAALTKYNRALAKKYVKLDKKIFDSIDYATPGKSFESWLTDKRVIARIKGDKPLTVGELTEEVQRKYYHGVDAKSAKRITKQRMIEVYESVVARKILLSEAMKQGIDKTQEYKDKVKEYENGVIFGMFVRKVVEPDSKLKEDEVKAYYDDHIKDYTYPEMVQLSSLVFAKRPDAESALEKLQKGDDFLWVKDNAEGQVTGTDDPLRFDGATLFVTNLPEDLQKVVSGAKAGSYGMYSATGQYYVVSIRDIIPSKKQPYEEVKDAIAKKLYNEKINKVTADWAAKLRASSEIKIYLSDSK
ncbi:MAG: peptidyl-prolyl cis-trans isomerase [Nitrospiraceae bacterium]|nr:peptidyl-prolyl cis-trans isomerase [Nitrospiraceae bacterium]